MAPDDNRCPTCLRERKPPLMEMVEYCECDEQEAAPALAWTSEKPSQDGIYWVGSPTREIGIVQITDGYTYDGRWVTEFEDDDQFFGPLSIVKPESPP